MGQNVNLHELILVEVMETLHTTEPAHHAILDIQGIIASILALPLALIVGILTALDSASAIVDGPDLIAALIQQIQILPGLEPVIVMDSWMYVTQAISHRMYHRGLIVLFPVRSIVDFVA